MNNDNLNTVALDTQTETTVAVETKVLKRQPGLGKINRLTKAAQATIAANGHENKRFKRDYNTGTATYTCPHCGATATATVSNLRGKSSVGGDALVLKCSVTNS
jgi:hypothetical protein